MTKRIHKQSFLWLFLFVFLALYNPSRNVGAVNIDLTEMSLEELMEIEVTSVTKKAKPLSESAAAIFVITGDDLRRSGVTNVPDALRMVPGLTVARIDANKWAVNSRGPHSRFSDKLLVLIDGRSVYTPSYSGVYWEVQDVMLEDVQRIEVIRGPGATLWGANAVNGVINIITKSAKDTQGGLVTIGGGSFEKAFAGVRYGGKWGNDGHGRVYAKGFERNEYELENGADAGDEWGMRQGGFRWDSQLAEADTLTVQGDIYEGDIQQTLAVPSVAAPPAQVVHDDADVAGGNLLARWQRSISFKSDVTLQAYYDRFVREEAFFRQQYDIIDLDFQHHLAAGRNHDMIWGLRYRGSHDKFDITPTVIVEPDSRWDNLFSAFVQDEIAMMRNRLWLTVGSKIEHNDYSGTEVQPGVRLLWAVDDRNRLWAAVSRAVRTPSRMETDGDFATAVLRLADEQLPPAEGRVLGNKDFDSEQLVAYEVGYRFLPEPAFSLDIAIFYNDYDWLRMSEQDTPKLEETYIVIPVNFTNEFTTRAYGAELAVAWRPFDEMKLDLSYTYLMSNFEQGLQAGVAPRHQLSFRSAYTIIDDLELDLWLRYMDEATTMRSDEPEFVYYIGDYWTADVRLAWRPVPLVEISLVGQNLFSPHHMESVQEMYSPPTEIQRAVYGKITFAF